MNHILLKLIQMLGKKKKQVLILISIFFGLILAGKAILFVNWQRSQDVGLNTAEDVDQDSDMHPDGIEGLPAEFPVYQDSDFVTYALSDDGKGRSYVWETHDEVGLVYEYLKSELRIKGWVLTNDSSVAGSYVVSFAKDEVVGFLGVFMGDSGKSIISVTIRAD